MWFLHGRVVIAIALVVSAWGAWVPGAVASTVAAAPTATGAPVCAGAESDPAVTSAADIRDAVACLIDAARAGHRLPKLHRDAHLAKAAAKYASALDPTKPLTHKGKGGTTPLDRIAAAGYGGGTFTAAETLGRAYGALATPAQRVQVWLSDKTIKKLLLSSKYRDVGVGISVHGTTTTYVVEVARAGKPAAHTAAATR
jgi:uncharacterized protein YkwD